MPSQKQRLQQKQSELVAEAKKVFDLATAEARPLTEAETKRDDEIQAELEAIKPQIASFERQEARERDFKPLKEWSEGEAPKEPKEKPAAVSPAPAGFATFGEYLQAIAWSKLPGRMDDPAAAGAIKKLYAAAGMSEGVGQDGGFLVGTQQEKTIREKVYETGQLLQRTDKLTVGAGFNGASIPAVDETSRADGSRFGGILAYWLGEGGLKTASKPKFHLMDMKLEKLAALVYVTDELLADATLLEAWLNSRLPMELTFRVEDAIVNGDGVGKPLGFLKSGAVITVDKVVGQAAATILYENILSMWSRLWAPSRPNAVWLVDQSAEAALYKMHMVIGTGGVPVYLPANGLADGPFGTLFGRPVIPHEYGAVLGTAGDIILADMSQYTTIDKGGIVPASSMHVRFEYDEMAFRWVWRIDGEASWKSAITPKSGGPTLAPFVALQTRA